MENDCVNNESINKENARDETECEEEYFFNMENYFDEIVNMIWCDVIMRYKEDYNICEIGNNLDFNTFQNYMYNNSDIGKEIKYFNANRKC